DQASPETSALSYRLPLSVRFLDRREGEVRLKEDECRDSEVARIFGRHAAAAFCDRRASRECAQGRDAAGTGTASRPNCVERANGRFVAYGGRLVLAPIAADRSGLQGHDSLVGVRCRSRDQAPSSSVLLPGTSERKISSGYAL